MWFFSTFLIFGIILFFVCVCVSWRFSKYMLKASRWWCHAFILTFIVALCVLRARIRVRANRHKQQQTWAHWSSKWLLLVRLLACLWIKISWKSTFHYLFLFTATGVSVCVCLCIRCICLCVIARVSLIIRVNILVKLFKVLEKNLMKVTQNVRSYWKRNPIGNL